MNAHSLDHLEIMTAEDISDLKNSGWKGICTLVTNSCVFPSHGISASEKIIGVRSRYSPGF